MKICLVTFSYKPTGGGVPRYVETTANKLSELGHSVDILTTNFDKDRRIKEEEGVRVYRLPCMNIFTEKNEKGIKAKEFLEFLREYSKKEEPDLFVAHDLHVPQNSLGHSISLDIASIERDIPTVLTVHAFLGNEEYSNIRVAAIKHLHWDKIIAVSSNLAEYLFGKDVESDKISVAYPPVDTELFKPGLGKKWLRSRLGISDKEKVILHASRLASMEDAEQKGAITLLKAFSLIDPKDTKLLFSVAPCSPTYKKSKEETLGKIKERAKLLGIKDKVIIETFNASEMPHVYNGADVFTMASQIESFGLVYAEAMACKLPVIGTSVGGVPEIITNNKDGYLLAPDEPTELSKRLKWILKSVGRREKMGEEAVKKIKEKFSLDKIIEKIIGIYKSAIYKKDKREEKNNK